LDPTTLPKQLDWHEGGISGKVQKGVYQLDGDILTVAFASEGNPRPSAVASTSGVSVYTLKRMRFKSPEYYEKKLLDKQFVWYGPVSMIERQPNLKAAQGLAYLGDPAVPALLRAVEDKRIDNASVVTALAEIGLPVDRDPYARDLAQHTSKSLKAWWLDNRERTAPARSAFRVGILLPPADGRE
jgi:hypothetical protein